MACTVFLNGDGDYPSLALNLIIQVTKFWYHQVMANDITVWDGTHKTSWKRPDSVVLAKDHGSQPKYPNGFVWKQQKCWFLIICAMKRFPFILVFPIFRQNRRTLSIIWPSQTNESTLISTVLWWIPHVSWHLCTTSHYAGMKFTDFTPGRLVDVDVSSPSPTWTCSASFQNLNWPPLQPLASNPPSSEKLAHMTWQVLQDATWPKTCSWTTQATDAFNLEMGKM